MLRARIVLPFFPVILILVTPTHRGLAAENPPSVDDVNTLAALARLTTNDFYRQTFEIRMRYEFADGFFPETDRQTLLDIAKKSSAHLGDIVVQLEDLQRQMDRYNGKDWNQRFGSTGLYEKAANHLSGARASKFGIDYCAVLAADGKGAKELLLQINSFTDAQDSFYIQLVKGRTLALLAKTDPDYASKCAAIFDKLRIRSDTSQRLAFLASIEQAKSKSTPKDMQADQLARDLAKTNLTDDPEVLLPLAFLLRRLGEVDNYNELLQSNSQVRAIAVGITLAWLESGHEPVNPLDGPLAAEAALRQDTQKHRELLLKLARQNASASPVIDYAAALAVADGNESQAAYLLIRAGKVLDAQSAEVLQITSEQIAAYAAKLAYKAFVKEPNQCELATDAFENYFELAGESPDPNLQYIYTQVLVLCGRYQQAVDILREIPPSAEELYPKAQLDLMSAEIASGPLPSIFDRARYAPLFSRYLRDSGDCIYLEQATILLQSYLEEIELLEADRTAYLDTVKHSKKIAGFIYDCIQDRMRASILAEFIALDPNAAAEELTTADKLLTAVGETDGDMLQAQARLAQRKKDYAEAARLWARIAQESETTGRDQRSWQWWRAKYYQLDCAAKTGQNRSDIAHAIDVLQGTYKDIPAPWADKLESLAKNFSR